MSSINQIWKETAELEKRIQEIFDGMAADIYKSLYEAAIKLHLSDDTLY